MGRREFDLLGDPIPENFGKPGANGHVATAENVNKVRLLVVANWTAAQIATELGVSVPTLNKHYFRNGSIKRAKAQSLAEAKGRILMQLDAAASAGNVAAQKQLYGLIEREALSEMARERGFASPEAMVGKPKGKKAKGKKEMIREEAAKRGSQWDFLPAIDKLDEVKH